MSYIKRLIIVGTSAIVVSACTASAFTAAVRLSVSVTEQPVGEELHYVAAVTMRNESATNVAVSRTHCACGLWLQLEIATVDGLLVPYPADMPERIIVRPPRYECIPPGGTTTMTIDLNGFEPEIAGERSEQIVSFQLQPGTYRLRARYRDTAARRKRCRSADMDLVSEWAAFTVRARDR